MYLEINIQDCFWSSAPSEVEKLKLQDDRDKSCPISSHNWEYWFQKWLEILKPDIPVAQNYELSLRLTGDFEIQTLNSQYRDQNQPTDVLAFATLEVNVPQPEIVDSDIQIYLGDIVISIETAFRQAAQQGHPLITELAWLAAHGFLHLLGWDHLDEESWQKMVKQQLFLLHAVGITLEGQITQDN
ncbi:MAG: rRNA maturation RNase YbeY [Okeania sp. SIO3I5]|uniref:rRNA maturation RNase YbeY n=1 Tax=Okeania sp. SIO3I5 TaxID=2607805 RepID=UPI0013B604C4|nr:rRNA maturation RNase YbeY [Okeania sp. SIO3I5]NEQ38326.1 rRNA maturation RNase YbeY [Okeania sp. SIO3I5]